MAQFDIPHLVAQHYCDGDFAYLTPKNVRTECDMVGDTLFAFAVKEAFDSNGDMDEYLHMLERAEEQLRTLREKLTELRDKAEMKAAKADA